jgi:predicted MPP superfamily phosphohydrolase
MILQAAPSFGVFETLTQYGALGVIVLGLGAVLWFMLRRQIASEDALKTKVEDLQKELNTYITQDAHKTVDALNNNTKALEGLKDLIMMSSKKTR